MKSFAAKLFLGTALCLAGGLTALPTNAQGPPAGGPPDPAPEELIVLLDHGPGVPTADEVAAAHGRDGEVPAGLGLGGPTRVKPLVSRRARGEEAEAHRLDPEHPAAKLQRYLVLTFPEGANLDAVIEAHERNPRILWVGRVRYAEISAVEPNDPWFDDDPGGMPRPAEQHQWGSYSLGLPDAWEYAKGHAQVGVLDTGIDADHEDLRAFGASGSYVGGNYRAHLSWDYQTDTAIVDDGAPINGHGTHVSGIVGATTNSGTGVAGACWHCSITMSQVSNTGSLSEADFEDALEGSIDRGLAILNMSFGWRPGANPPDCATEPNDPLCVVLELAEQREVLLVAAAGNDGTSQADWPSIDPRVLGAGGIAPDDSFWNDCPGTECGSNADPDQLVTPAKAIFSTFYFGLEYAPSIGCSDNVDGVVDGYGPCTGTSMSSPYLTASAGILRSINPLLSPAEIRDLLVSNLENPPGWNPANGIGKPNVHEAVKDALGRSGGVVIDNRLTPLFQLYGFDAEDHAYTTFPQTATGLKRGFQNDYRPAGPDVPGYDFFPGGNCSFVPCPAAASVYVFSGDRSPNGHPLVPLYRLSFAGEFPPGAGNLDNRDHTYTTEAAGIEAFVGVGYDLDGVEGYIYERCSPEPSCIPAGATRLYRYYNAARDDWAIFPESELSQWVSDGYSAQSGANPWIGYVYENVDSDGDWVIDGFEGLIGTNPAVADSDGDGLTDGQEVLEYPLGDPLVGAGPQPIGEHGTVSVNHVAQTVFFSRSYTNPVVLAQPPSYNGAGVSVIRITNVQSDRFTLVLDEAPDLDGTHTSEQVSWIVLESGSWTLPNGRALEVGTRTTNQTVGKNVSGQWATVTFPHSFSTVPVVLTQVQTNNDPAFVKTRQGWAVTYNFSVALEEEEAATTWHGTETIGWVAIEPSSGSWSGHTYQAGSTGSVVNHDFQTLSFSVGFSASPHFMASMATRNGADNAGLRFTGLSASGVWGVKVEEDTTYDSETTHTTEDVHFLAIEGSGTLLATSR